MRFAIYVNLYSDNGTTFIGANKKMNAEISEIMKKNPEFKTQIINSGTQWHFIPPATPHFGGIWEAGVKSMKFHLKRVIGQH